MALTRLRVSILQLLVDKNLQPSENLTRGVQKLREAAAVGSECIILPEFFANPNMSKKYAENIPDGEVCQALASEAKNLGVHIIGGTILEQDKQSNKIFNTTPVFGPTGELLASYRKTHKSATDLPGMHFMNDFDLGSKISMFSIGPWKIGLVICVDQVFPELSRMYSENGCHMIIMITLWPKPHFMGDIFQPLLRTRAFENQTYMIAACQARNSQDAIPRQSHSIITAPTGIIVKEAGIKEEILTCDLDFDEVIEQRKKILLSSTRRADLYKEMYHFNG